MEQDPSNPYKKKTDYSKLRIIQKNLVYVIGLSPALADEKVRCEYDTALTSHRYWRSQSISVSTGIS